MALDNYLDKHRLLTDGYVAYDKYARNKPDITQAQCWAHARRYFIKAESPEPEAVARALEYIGELYAIEQTIRERELDAEQALKLRTTKSHPIAEAFFAWCHEQRQRTDLVNSNPLAKALTYVTNHQEQLKVYLGDPEVPIDTNHLERALRVIPMGRKNWMFCWSEVGAEQVGGYVAYDKYARNKPDRLWWSTFAKAMSRRRRTILHSLSNANSHYPKGAA